MCKENAGKTGKLLVEFCIQEQRIYRYDIISYQMASKCRIRKLVRRRLEGIAIDLSNMH